MTLPPDTIAMLIRMAEEQIAEGEPATRSLTIARDAIAAGLVEIEHDHRRLCEMQQQVRQMMGDAYGAAVIAETVALCKANEADMAAHEAAMATINARAQRDAMLTEAYLAGRVVVAHPESQGDHDPDFAEVPGVVS